MTVVPEILFPIYVFSVYNHGLSVLGFFFLQKVVEEEESQVKKSSSELFSPSSKQEEPDPVRKVSC